MAENMMVFGTKVNLLAVERKYIPMAEQKRDIGRTVFS
jgi:hypothetical protein